MKVFEYADAYGMQICEARFPASGETAGYAEWFKGMLLISLPGTKRDLLHIKPQDLAAIFGDRLPVHAFAGCNNRVWILEPGDEEAILALEAERAETAWLE